MSTTRIVVLAAVGLIALAGAVYGLTELLRSERTGRFAVTVPVQRVVVDVDDGDVEIRAGLTPGIEAEHRDRWLLDGPAVTSRVRDGVLEVTGRCPDMALQCHTDLTLDVPPMMDVRVRTRDGDIDLRGLRGRADVHTGAGDVRARRVEPVTIAATTDEGDVALDLFGSPTAAAADTDAGDVDVIVPYGPYRVDADGTNTRVLGLVRDDLAARRIEAFSDAGDVLVRAR